MNDKVHELVRLESYAWMYEASCITEMQKYMHKDEVLLEVWQGDMFDFIRYLVWERDYVGIFFCSNH